MALEVSLYSFKYFSMATEVTNLQKEPIWTSESWFVWCWFYAFRAPEVDTQHSGGMIPHTC